MFCTRIGSCLPISLALNRRITGWSRCIEGCTPCHHNSVSNRLLQNMVPVAEAREARNAAEAREAVEAAQAAASAALAAELEVTRKGRADAEAREAALQEEVRRV